MDGDEDNRQHCPYVVSVFLQYLTSIAVILEGSLTFDIIDKVSDKGNFKNPCAGTISIFFYFQGIADCFAAIELIESKRLNISLDQNVLNKWLGKLKNLNSLLHQEERKLNEYKNEDTRLKTDVQVCRINSSNMQEDYMPGTYLLRIVQIDGNHIFLEIISTSDGQSCYVYALLLGAPICFKTVDNHIILPDFEEEGCELGFLVPPTEYEKFIENLKDILVEVDSTTEISQQSKDDDEKKESGQDIVPSAELIAMEIAHFGSVVDGKIDTFRSYLTSFFPKAVDVPQEPGTVRNCIAVIREGTEIAKEASKDVCKDLFDSVTPHYNTAPETSNEGFIKKKLCEVATASKKITTSVDQFKDTVKTSVKDNIEQGVTHIFGESVGKTTRDVVDIVDDCWTVKGNVIVKPKDVPLIVYKLGAEKLSGDKKK